MRKRTTMHIIVHQKTEAHDMHGKLAFAFVYGTGLCVYGPWCTSLSAATAVLAAISLVERNWRGSQLHG
jgi:hypothetical protein